jgi:cellulose synthase/poly-beta-1,6-N-acetylglucosamine synthase-like glycosyltransferase
LQTAPGLAPESDRPIPTWRAVLALLFAWSLTFAGLIGLASALGGDLRAGLGVALFFVAQELATTLVVSGLAVHGLRRDVRRSPPSDVKPRVSVIVAAYDESGCIAETIRSVQAQRGVELELIVADDGSRDGTAELVEQAFADVIVLRLAHAGKGAALEAARRVASHPILITIDADTILAPDALARIAAPFEDARVEAAAGAVVPRSSPSWLVRFQITEYLKNTLLRRGWSALGALEQVPGAFAAIRASALAAAGGFPVDSLTEDYEVAYRLYANAAREGRAIRIPTIVDARAYTEPPRTLAGLVRQRTRWFAGFLSTLFRFRRLVLRPSARTFGLVRLPLKVLDAVLPPIGLVSLVFLALGLASGEPAVTALSLGLLLVRAVSDAIVHALAIRAHQRARHPDDPTRAPALPSLCATALLEPWSFAWLKQIAVLRAYPFALSRVQTWEPSRERPEPTPKHADEPAPAE